MVLKWLCVCVWAHVWCQLATSMRIFTYKLATYLTTGDNAGLQNAQHRVSLVARVM